MHVHMVHQSHLACAGAVSKVEVEKGGETVTPVEQLQRLTSGSPEDICDVTGWPCTGIFSIPKPCPLRPWKGR